MTKYYRVIFDTINYMKDEMINSKIPAKEIYTDFRKSFIQYNLKAARKFAFFAILLYFSFYLFDVYLTELVQSNNYQLPILFSILIGLLVSSTHVSWLKNHWQILFALSLFIAGLGVIICRLPLIMIK